ncbi:AraC family transcriptional regulator [Cohnella abietis]|uniref:HTH-type transcriptional activator Btr n=1 Tax=Cohnella abietis TaxID=2507935 RepID=A0A3T1CZ13_9BACL|nr:AraC family transcriptional regulator [Cohnella abietis]BBI31009.1 hypothetical protein KCTCHS21_04080 [Cohnella abietis]
MHNPEKDSKTTEYISLESMCFKLREIEHINNTVTEWGLRLQFIESHILIIAGSGQGWLTVDGRFIELRQGSAYICTPGQLIETSAHSFDERGLYYLRFDVIEDTGLSVDDRPIVKRDSQFPVKDEVIVSSPVSVNALCETICHNLQNEDRLERFRSQILFHELLHTILHDALLVQGNDSERALEYVKAYIEQHYQEELTIEHLAKVAGLSSRHFMRLFKKRFAYSAIDYLTAYRIEQAQQLMRTGGEHRLRDIARHVGYHDDIYFRRKFKQVSGIPPAAFMKYSRKKVVAYHPSNIGQLIALQVTPCAAPADHPWTGYYQRKYHTNSVLALSSNDSIKREELRLAHPDFIVGIDCLVSAEEQAALREIAPTFLVPWLENDWRVHLRSISQFLDQTAAAEIWIDKYERKARFVREQVRYTIKDDSLLILRISGDRYHVLGNRSLGTVFYDDLQVVPTQGVDLMKTDQQITPVQLTALDADRLLLIVDQDALSQSHWHTLMHSELWRDLKAFRNRRVDFLPSYPWIEYTAFTHDLMLNEALKLWRDRT